ncbi:carbon-nitrogen hydrolase family protein [Nocardia sp. XZ_19_385]|uniref:carbon-nitrogen hydrolase family protein n=1 Tax=Nocardia sp. XZ_19_385 TaxID=2769488 RepID=UPI00188F7A01|nr:carbon-nitrogen hydrolase family protein [Nocardia sp. XZ_19_385]
MAGIKVAAIQATSENGAVARNLENAGRLVRLAVERGAELVVCPEFLAAGYTYDEIIWESAEPRGGATETWLAALASEHDIYVGAGYLEADGDQFYNTFTLFGPGGELMGRVRKGSLPFCEGWYFAPSSDPKVIETPLGRIGVGICNDNQTAEFYRHMIDESPDLLLMPHSAPTPRVPVVAGWFREMVNSVAEFYAREFGIPVVFSNKVATRTNWTPLSFVPLLRLPMRCEGFSSVHAAGGERLAYAEDRETAVVGTIEIDPTRKRRPTAQPDGYLVRTPDLLTAAGGRVFEVFTRLGDHAYTTNTRRAPAAHAAANR